MPLNVWHAHAFLRAALRCVFCCISAVRQHLTTLFTLYSFTLLFTLWLHFSAETFQVFHAGLALDSRGRSLMQLALPPPANCDGWNAVGSDGRCRYSDCFVGNDPIPANPDCFGCQPQDCNNGCGAADGISSLAPESIPFVFDFTDGCCNHDYCYASTAFEKSQCDLSFLKSNLDSCATVSTAIKTIRLLLNPNPAALLTYCPTYALAYYTAVALGGGSAYSNAQASTVAHEESDKCVAMCPSTQRSGGQGTTTLRIDMLRKSGTFPVSYQMYSIPDALDITYEGASIFSTGGLVSGSRSTTASFDGDSTIVTVTIDAPRDGTAWDVFIGCPE